MKLKQLVIIEISSGCILSGFLFRPEEDATDRLISCLASLFLSGKKVSHLGGNMIRSERLVDFLRKHDVRLLRGPTDWGIDARTAELVMMRDDRRMRCGSQG